MLGKIQAKFGFEFFCERFIQFSVWYFRPIGAQLWVQFLAESKARKPELLQLLKDVERAQVEYDRGIAALTDVEAAQRRLEHAKQARKRYEDPNFDPGNRGRSNPGAVARDLRLAGESAEAVTRAETAVAEAIKARAIVLAGNRRA